MKHAIAWPLLLCLAPIQAACAETADTDNTSPMKEGVHDMKQDKIDVQATIDRMTSSFEKNDIDIVMQTYEPGATVLFEPGKPVTGAAQLRELFAGMAAAKPQFTYSGHEVVVSGDTAIHIAPWQMIARAPDGQEISQSGLSVAVLRRQADGSWKMVIDNPHGSRLLTTAR